MSEKVPIRRLPTGVPGSMSSRAAVCPSSRSM